MKQIKIFCLKKNSLFLELQWSEAVATFLLKLSHIAAPGFKIWWEVSVTHGFRYSCVHTLIEY